MHLAARLHNCLLPLKNQTHEHTAEQNSKMFLRVPTNTLDPRFSQGRGTTEGNMIEKTGVRINIGMARNRIISISSNVQKLLTWLQCQKRIQRDMGLPIRYIMSYQQ